MGEVVLRLVGRGAAAPQRHELRECHPAPTQDAGEAHQHAAAQEPELQGLRACTVGALGGCQRSKKGGVVAVAAAVAGAAGAAAAAERVREVPPDTPEDLAVGGRLHGLLAAVLWRWHDGHAAAAIRHGVAGDAAHGVQKGSPGDEPKPPRHLAFDLGPHRVMQRGLGLGDLGAGRELGRAGAPPRLRGVRGAGNRDGDAHQQLAADAPPARPLRAGLQQAERVGDLQALDLVGRGARRGRRTGARVDVDHVEGRAAELGEAGTALGTLGPLLLVDVIIVADVADGIIVIVVVVVLGGHDGHPGLGVVGRVMLEGRGVGREALPAAAVLLGRKGVDAADGVAQAARVAAHKSVAARVRERVRSAGRRVPVVDGELELREPQVADAELEGLRPRDGPGRAIPRVPLHVLAVGRLGPPGQLAGLERV